MIAEKGKAAPKNGPSDKENLTVLIAANANGELVTPLALFSYERMPEYVLKAAPKSRMSDYAFSSVSVGAGAGFLNGVYKWSRLFRAWFAARNHSRTSWWVRLLFAISSTSLLSFFTHML